MKRLIFLLLCVTLFSATLTVPTLADGQSPTDPDAPSLGVFLDRDFTFLFDVKYTTLSGGKDHMAALRPDGTLWVWGGNEYGQLGLGTTRTYNAPINVMTDVAWVRAGDNVTLAVKTDGTLWAFGSLENIKNGTLTPTRIASNVRAADSADGLIAVVTRDGALKTYEDGPNSNPVTYATEGVADVAVCPGTGIYGKAPVTGTIAESVKNFVNEEDNWAQYIVYALGTDGSLTRYFNAGGTLHTEKVAQNVTAIQSEVNPNDSTLIYLSGDGTLHTCMGSDPNGFAPKIRFSNVAEFSSNNQQLYVVKTDGSLWDGVRNALMTGSGSHPAGISNMGAFYLKDDGTLAVANSGNPYANLTTTMAWSNELIIATGGILPQEPFYSKAWEIVGDADDDYEKAVRICDWMDKNLCYDSTLKNHNPKTMLATGVGVCEAYSSLTMEMFMAVGIPCTEISDSKGLDHAWNRAIIDGVTVYIDNTHKNFDFSLNKEAANYPSITAFTGSGVTHSPWAGETIRAAYSTGLADANMGGDLTKPATRAQFCALAYSFIREATGKNMDALLAEKGLASVVVPFTDTQDENVAAIYRLNAIKGAGGTLFNPKGNITRQEVATIIRALAQTLGDDVATDPADFADDAAVADWARTGVDFVAHSGIMTGRPEGFVPTANISIEEVIVTFYKYLTWR